MFLNQTLTKIKHAHLVIPISYYNKPNLKHLEFCLSFNNEIYLYHKESRTIQKSSPCHKNHLCGYKQSCPCSVPNIFVYSLCHNIQMHKLLINLKVYYFAIPKIVIIMLIFMWRVNNKKHFFFAVVYLRIHHRKSKCYLPSY